MEAPTLTDHVVALRPVTESDLDEITEILSTVPDISQWTRIPWPYARSDAETWLEASRTSWANGTGASFVITDAASGRLLGGIGCHNIGIETDPRTSHLTNEVGYWLRPDARGQGSVTKALRLLVDWCFSELGLDVVRLQAMHGNDRSRAIADRLDFTYLGRVLAEDVTDECRDAHRYELVNPAGAPALPPS